MKSNLSTAKAKLNFEREWSKIKEQMRQVMARFVHKKALEFVKQHETKAVPWHVPNRTRRPRKPKRRGH